MSNSESSVQIPTPCYFMVIDILGFSRVIWNLSGKPGKSKPCQPLLGTCLIPT